MSYSTDIPTVSTLSQSLQNATGKMRYRLTNDYLFRAIFQESNGALKQLICAILGLSPDEIISVEITNPIELGKSIDAKDFILDIRVLLNNHTLINIGMQVLNLGNWPERSLGYLCRSFDSLNKGEDYMDTKPVIQVCFLDFTLFKDAPEFYSNYMFMNIKNHRIYSDKLKLSVVDLTQIDRATEEDKLSGMDHWARLFKATTWDEIKMFAENNSYLAEAAETAYQLSTEETIRMQCEAREDYYNRQRYLQKRLERMEQLEQEQVQLKKEQMQLKQEKEYLTQKNLEKEKLLAARDEELIAKNGELVAKNEEIARLKVALAQKNKEYYLP